MSGLVGAAECARWIGERDAFVIASHTDPDGDSLGSALALAAALRQRGKRATAILAQGVPARLAWLPGAEQVQVIERVPDAARAVILIECSDFERAGVSGLDALESLNIDHHASNARYADLNWVDPSVAAAGMMLERLVQALGVRLDAAMAAQLYVTVLTDTGSFRHSNTDAEALEFAARMVRAGAVPDAIAREVYGHVPAARVLLLADALATLRFAAGGRIAWMALRLADFRRRGTRDTDGFITHAQEVAGVVVSALFKEVAASEFRVSLRSDGSVDVAALAATLGGGGHPRAAGFALRGEFDTVRRRVLRALRARLPAAEARGEGGA